MGKIMFRRGLAILLALVMFFSLDLSAFAEENNSANQTESYLIGLKSSSNPEKFVAKKKSVGKKVKKGKRSNTLSMNLTSAEVQDLQKDADVAFVESDSIVNIESIDRAEKNHDFARKVKKNQETIPWGIHAVGADLTKNKASGKGVKVAVLDTGISLHSDLQIAGGVSFVDGISSYSDDNGHGTHVAGTIAALQNKDGVVGVADKAEIYSVKVLNESGSGSYSQVIQGIEWAIENKMNVISMSFGGAQFSQALKNAIQAADQAGIIIVAAAGNSGKGEETELYPALFSEAISVGAVTKSNQIASFSSTGNEVDIVAPGSEIVSTLNDGTYGVMSGTSMAVPHVTGAVAALLSANKKWNSVQVKDTLFNTATPLGDPHEYGHGMINLARALGIINSPIPPLEDSVPNEPTTPQEPEPTPTPPSNLEGFDILKADESILQAFNMLAFLSDQANANNNLDLAKRIENKKNDFIKISTELHSMPAQIQDISKDSVGSYTASQQSFFNDKSVDFNKLIDQMNLAISEFKKQFPNLSDEIGVQAYDLVGNNQHIYPGGSATVSLKLSSSKPTVTIGVFDPSGTKITGTVLSNVSANVPVSYNWTSSSSAVTGTYQIKYYYDTTNPADLFYVYVDPRPAPSAPSGLSTSATNNSITLFWSASSGATSYSVSLNGSTQGSTTGTSYTFNNLTSGATYTVGVAAVNSSGSSAFSTTSRATLPNAPGAPAGLSASPDTNAITLTWNGVSGATSYRVYLNGSNITSVSTTNYTFSGLTQGTSYTLGVAAVNTSGTSAISTINASTTIPGAPVAPTGLAATSTTSSITLTWNAVSGATSYSLRLNGTNVTTTTLTSYTYTGLTANTTYTLGVAATNAIGTSAYSTYSKATQSVTIPALTLNTPIDVDLPSGISQVYTFTPSVTTLYQIYTGPFGGTGANNDTILEIYSDAGLTSLLSSNDDSNGTNFSTIKVNLNAGTTYYVKLKGFSSTAVHARINAIIAPPDPIVINLNSSVNVDAVANLYKLYKFTPSTSGSYKIATGYYGGSASSGTNDTLLYAYSDAALLTQIGYNDDSNGTTFSELKLNLTAGVSYYIKVAGFGGGAVHANLTVTANTSIEFTDIINKVNYEMNNVAGQISYFKFTTPSTVGAGNYRFYTSPYQGTGANNDTIIEIYSNQALTTLIASNDDVSENPYGGNFSKVELSLSANTTYYIKVRPYSSTGTVLARFTVEDDFDSTPSLAVPATWEQIYSQDLSSRYDTDYYKVVVTEPTSVHLNVTVNTITLLDSSSNVVGIFTPDNVDSFDISAGTYYAKVAYNEDYTSNILSAADEATTLGLGYELSHKQATVSYGSAGIASQALQSFIDPSKADLSDYATITWGYSSDHNGTLVQVIDQQNYVIYEETLGFRAGSCTPYGAPDYVKVSPCKHSFVWNGKVNKNVSRAIPVYNVYNGDLEYYYAKNGKYSVKIKPTDQYSQHASVQKVTVINQATTLTGLIPAPPIKTQKKSGLVNVTASNKDKCLECRNYFYKYIWSKTSSTPQETQYVGWSGSIYGLNGLERFWKGAELFVYDPNKSVLDNVLNLSSIAGMFVPVFDAANSVVYLMKGDEVNASISAISAIPFYGDGIAGVKLIRRLHYLSGCINCFTAGTKVTTPDGEVSIENIKVGDLVLSKDPITEVTAYKSVEQVFQKDIDESWKITVGGEIITTTSEHPFWIVDKGWVLAKDLTIGDQFETYDGSKIFVEKIENIQEHNVVYNFAVQDFHTYYVTNLKILTHNAACLTAADYIAKNVSQYTSRLTSGTSGNILAKELEAASISAPSIPGVDKWAAHHIIAKTVNNNPNIQKAQTILSNHGIDINSAANGVWLPMRKGESAIDIDGTFVSTHNGYHVGDYFKYVADTLEPVKNNKQDVLHAIESIRQDLLTGKIRLGNIE
ncbi:S8 family serine peptidase [Paenibacillus sp. MMO-177]|uniref:S8 family serine peptidase n=1 Tax=Paenibacillus sp. MMO-177 TaxID=3081289 RepID=UPI0030181E91